MISRISEYGFSKNTGIMAKPPSQWKIPLWPGHVGGSMRSGAAPPRIAAIDPIKRTPTLGKFVTIQNIPLNVRLPKKCSSPFMNLHAYLPSKISKIAIVFKPFSMLMFK